MQIDEGKSMVGLVQRDIGGRIGDLGVEGDFCVVLGMDGGTLSDSPGGVAVLAKLFLDEHLFPVVVHKAFSVADK